MIRIVADELATDYTLAKKLYICFAPCEEDLVLQNALQSYESQRKEVLAQIEAIRTGFPFNAPETLNSPAKTQEYMAELQVRDRHCEEEKSELERKITELIGRQMHG